MGKREKAPVAVIDIGSNALRLKVAETGKNRLKYIESLNYPLSLGRDTFDIGKISFEKLEKTCSILKNFQIVAAEYGVEEILTVATSAVREAANKDYFLDQIKIKTNLQVRIMDNSEEILYIYKLIMYLLEEQLKKNTLMVYIGSGNMGVAVMEEGKISFAQTIQTGSLRISEIFMEVQDQTDEYYYVVEEYLNSLLTSVQENVPVRTKCFVASGHEISLIARLCEAQPEGLFFSIAKPKFMALYDAVKFKTVERICLDYNLPVDKGEVLLPAMSVFFNLLQMTSADYILAPSALLADSMLMEALYPQEFIRVSKEFQRSTILSARQMAKKFLAADHHGDCVEKYALKIFDKMKKIHGMGSREKLLLQTSAILHDVGKFINYKKHYIHSYNIITGADIVGLSRIENEIVANICLFHGKLTPENALKSYTKLKRPHRVLVSKLAAILRLADALDRSGAIKFHDIDVKLTDKELMVTIESDQNTELERWSFNRKRALFEEVFGLKAILKKKRVN